MFVECVASWVENDAEKAEVYDLFRDTPLPLGWGSEGMAGGELTGRVWRA